ncbi:TSUP family transporter [bacterium]|nr:TSUP family transporter [bacterium]
MIDLSPAMLVAASATFFAAGLVKGVTGMGLPTVAMGVLGTLVSPLAAASLLIAPSFVTNVWQLFAGPNFAPLLRRLWPMMLAVVAGTMPGTAWIAGGDTRTTTTFLGIALIIYSSYTLFARQISFPPRIESWLSPLIGGITGLVTGGTGVFVIPAVPYLQALGLSKEDLVQALGLSFTISTVALAIGLGAHGAFQGDRLAISALAVIPALAGMWAGQHVRSRISPPVFRRGFLVCLLLLGCEMATRPML